jgi:hypothetical protein
VRKKRAVKRRIPYPFVPPPASKVTSWDDYFAWSAARYRARDNFGRIWRNRGVVLPEVSPEWDPPIPRPPSSCGPKPKVNLKTVAIPVDWSFEDHALPKEEQDRYHKLLYT